MENNYFYDLPEDLQQMIYEKEHKMRMQDVLKDINEVNQMNVYNRNGIYQSTFESIWTYGKDYTKNLVGKDMWDDMKRIMGYEEDGDDWDDNIQHISMSEFTRVSATEDEEEESETEEEIFEFNEEESDDENPFPECDECGDWGNGYGISIYQKRGHWYCAGCMEIMEIQKLLSINNEVV